MTRRAKEKGMASRLAAVIEPPSSWVALSEYTATKAELSALLAVAKAAKALARLTESAARNGCQTCAADWALVRAVDRLARASRGET